MTAPELVEKIKLFCSENADVEKRKKYARYFRLEIDAYGLTQPQMNLFAKILLQDKNVDIRCIMDATPALFTNGKYEEITIALLLLNGRKKQYTQETFSFVEKLYQWGITNWAHADTLGMWIVPELIKKGIINIADLQTWITSKNSYQRRTVPVSFIKSLKTLKGYALLFEIIEPLMCAQKREEQQGTGWFLREAWKIRPQETEAFLMKWKDTAPRLIYQIACEKMDKTDKMKLKKN